MTQNNDTLAIEQSVSLSYITMYSLVDISTTGTIGRYKLNQTNLLGNLLDNELIWKKSRNQQRNWETAIQIIGLRAQPMYLENSIIHSHAHLKDFDFGKKYTSNQTVWTLVFGVEHESVYNLNNIELHSLIEDFNGVPITLALNETVKFNTPTFITTGDFKNTYFKANISQ